MTAFCVATTRLPPFEISRRFKFARVKGAWRYRINFPRAR